MNRAEDLLMENVSKEATSSILSDHGGVAPFDVDALIIRPGFENSPFADEPLRIIGSAVRLAIATLIQDVTAIPDNMDSFFERACRSTFNRLKMAPVSNYIPGDLSPCHPESGHTIDAGFDSLLDLGPMTEIGVPVHRLAQFIHLDTHEKETVYPKIFGMRQLSQLKNSLPKSDESNVLAMKIDGITHVFIDFTQQAMRLISHDSFDDHEFRAGLVTLRLEFIKKLGNYSDDLLYGEYVDLDGEHADTLSYVQIRLREILEEATQYLVSL